jgi:hypothetical protein
MATAAVFAAELLTGNESGSVLAGKIRTASYVANDVQAAMLTRGSEFATTMGGLINASKARDAAVSTAEAASTLTAMGTTLEGAAAAQADAMAVHEATYRRQFEINEWTAANRQETLFVYQFIFFTVCVLTILAGLYRMNVISGYFTSFASFLAVFVMVMIIVYRAQYTAFKRDKRYWNKRRFDRGAGPIFAAPNCPAVGDFLTNLPGNFEGAVQEVQGAAKRGAGTLGSALVSAGNALGGTTQ